MNRRTLFGRIGMAAAAAVTAKVVSLPSPTAAAIPSIAPFAGLGLISRQTLLEQWGVDDAESWYVHDDEGTWKTTRIEWPMTAAVFNDRSILRFES